MLKEGKLSTLLQKNQAMSSDSESDEETAGSLLPQPLHPLQFLDYSPEYRDVILVSYPKCDTKTIEMILWKLLRPRSDLPSLPDSPNNRYLPCVETVGLMHIISENQWPRLFKTHLRRALVPIHNRAKYIYVLRNPWDVVVACYKSSNCESDFDNFFQQFVDNKKGYGNFFEHVRMWTSKTTIELRNFIAVAYESVKWQPRSALYTVAAFLGEPYLDALLQDDKVAAGILKEIEERSASSRRMKRRARSSDPSKRWHHRRSLLSAEQIKIIEQNIESHLKGTDIDYQWKNMLKEGKIRAVSKEPENPLNETI